MTGRLRLLEGQRQDAVARLREKREAIIEKARAKVDAAVAKARLEIKEVVLRRLSHREWSYPDLILIDGGVPQLNAALSAKNERESAKNIAFAALAKRNNELFIENRKSPVLLTGR